MWCGHVFAAQQTQPIQDDEESDSLSPQVERKKPSLDKKTTVKSPSDKTFIKRPKKHEEKTRDSFRPKLWDDPLLNKKRKFFRKSVGDEKKSRSAVSDDTLKKDKADPYESDKKTIPRKRSTRADKNAVFPKHMMV